MRCAMRCKVHRRRTMEGGKSGMKKKMRKAAPEEWPDLQDYNKAILLRGMTMENVEQMLNHYANYQRGKHGQEHVLRYTTAPPMAGWVYLKFNGSAMIDPVVEFYYYQELMVWMGKAADTAFCLAVARTPDPDGHRNRFVAEPDDNPFMVSTQGILHGKAFSYGGAGVLRIGAPVPAGFSLENYLQEHFSFDLSYLPQSEQAWTVFRLDLPQNPNPFER